MFEDIFIRFDATHERGRHTDRRTDGQTLHDVVAAAAFAAGLRSCNLSHYLLGSK